MNSCDSVNTSSESSKITAVTVQTPTAKVSRRDEKPTPKELYTAVRAIGPTLLKRYVAHQAVVCKQAEADLNRSLRSYLFSLTGEQVGETQSFSVGDLWSGLIWWRDEASWVGVVGVFSLGDVKALAIEILSEYLSSETAGTNHVELHSSLKYGLAERLFSAVTSDHSAPGLRAVVARAASLA